MTGRMQLSQERLRVLGYSLSGVVAALTVWVALARPNIGLALIAVVVVLTTIAGVLIWGSLLPGSEDDAPE